MSLMTWCLWWDNVQSFWLKHTHKNALLKNMLNLAQCTVYHLVTTLLPLLWYILNFAHQVTLLSLLHIGAHLPRLIFPCENVQ